MPILCKRHWFLCAIRFGIATPVSFAAMQHNEFVSKCNIQSNDKYLIAITKSIFIQSNFLV